MLNDDKIIELSKRTIKILELTKKQIDRYKDERKKLYDYYIKQSNLKEWEQYIIKMEEVIDVANKYDKTEKKEGNF